jgi:hypothetical protein
MTDLSLAADCTITRSGDGHFDAVVSDRWTVGGKPNGGYLLALLGRAAVAVGPHEHVITASTLFLSAPDTGAVWITADVLRAGRSATQVRTRMGQGDKTCVEALMTTAQLDPDTRPFWTADQPSAGTVPFEECVRVPAVMPSGAPATLMASADMRIEPDSAGYLSPTGPSGRGILRGWLALPGESFDTNTLLWAIDAFPPATFDVEVTGWVPTLELTAYVRARPAPGPLRILQRAHLVDGQRMDEACFLWDSTGRLVAQSTQLAAIRLG